MVPFTEGVTEIVMEYYQEDKLRRAKKRVRNLVAKDNPSKGRSHKSLKDYNRKNKHDWLKDDESDLS